MSREMTDDARKVIPAQPAPAPVPKSRFVWIFRILLYAGLAAVFALGGPVTRFAAGAAALFALFGDSDGAVRHVLRFVALGLAVWLAPDFGPAVGDWIGPSLGLSLVIAKGVGTIVAGVAIFVGMSLLARALAGRLHQRPVFSTSDHCLGALLGAAEGVLLVAATCWVIATFEEPLAMARYRVHGDSNAPSEHWIFDHIDRVRLAVHQDPAGRWFSAHNPLPEMPVFKTMRNALDAATNPEAYAAVGNDERFRAFAKLPEVKKHLDAIQEDEKLREALGRHDIITVMRSEQFNAMLNDRELYDTVVTNWNTLREVLSEVDVSQLNAGARSADPALKRPVQKRAKAAGLGSQ